MASENIGNVYPTKIPGYDDAADIQAALRLYHYGSETYDVNNTDLAQLVNPSLAYTLNDLQDQIDDALANPAAAADVQDAEPVSPVDGFLWVQSNAVVSGFPISATSVYQNTEPTFGLVDGLIWAKANTTPIQLEIYDQTSNTFNEVTLPAQSGNSGKYLTTDGSNPSWATVSSGGQTLLETITLSGASVVSSTIPGSYNDLVLIIQNFRPANNGAHLQVRINSDSNTRYINQNFMPQTYNVGFTETAWNILLGQSNNASTQSLGYVSIPSYSNTTTWKAAYSFGATNGDSTSTNVTSNMYKSYYNQTNAITTLTFFADSGNMTSGSVLIYGVK